MFTSLLEYADPTYGWLLVLAFLLWELYNPLPFYDTKIQQYLTNFEREIRQLRTDHADTKDRLVDIRHQLHRTTHILRAVVRETDGVQDEAASRYLVEDDVPVSHFQDEPSEEDIDMDKREYEYDTGAD